MRRQAAGCLLVLLACGGCTAMKPSDFADNRPLLKPDEYFLGRTRSVGVVENRGGAPTQQVTTSTRGRMAGGVLHLEQELRFGSDRTEHRSWRVRRVDEHHFTATANDMVGTARGEAYGNVFHWKFTLAMSPGNPLANIEMSQWMYLQPDRRTLLNHTTIRKAGLVLAQVTEQFRREGE